MTNQTTLLIWQVVATLCAVGIAIAGFAIFSVKARIEREAANKAAMTGVIAPAKPIKIILDAHANVWPEIELGVDSGAILIWEGPQGEPLFKVAGDNDITLVIEHGVVKISATIRDTTGTIIAQIIKNEWKINPGASWDRNYSSDAVEVMDPTGDVVLQAIALSDRVQFSARLHDDTGRQIGFGSAKPGTPGAGGVVAVGPDGKLPTIPPIFKYPSNTHLGERM